MESADDSVDESNVQSSKPASSKVSITTDFEMLFQIIIRFLTGSARVNG